MTLYEYKAMTSYGKKVSGSLEATSERDAKDKLREQNLLLLSLDVKKGNSRRENLKGENLVSFTVLLSQLVGGGVPLFESLMTIEEQYREESFHAVILSLCDQIKAGASLSQAMSKHPSTFDRLYCAMVSAGELSGTLDKVLLELSQFLSRQLELKKKVSIAMIYPGVLACFSLLILVVLLTFVVPSIESIFEDRQVNKFTATVLGVSHFFRDYWWLFFTFFGGLSIWLIRFLKSPNGKSWLGKVLLRLPLFSRMIIQGALGRFCRTMATLQGGGVTLIDSLRVAREVMRNEVLETEIRVAEQKVIEGSSLSTELKRSCWIPSLVPRMIAVGEDSGTSVSMFQRISEIYEGELEKTLERVVALAQPVILIVMGGIIGIVLLAVLLPMADFSSLTK